MRSSFLVGRIFFDEPVSTSSEYGPATAYERRLTDLRSHAYWLWFAQNAFCRPPCLPSPVCVLPTKKDLHRFFLPTTLHFKVLWETYE